MLMRKGDSTMLRLHIAFAKANSHIAKNQLVAVLV